MRNPDRLDEFYNTFKIIHKERFPDWRFGQLISNFFGWLYGNVGVDCFFPEEDKMIEYFERFASVYGDNA